MFLVFSVVLGGEEIEKQLAWIGFFFSDGLDWASVCGKWPGDDGGAPGNEK